MASTHTLYSQLEAMRPQLVRFAQLQLGNQALAGDAVQDAKQSEDEALDALFHTHFHDRMDLLRSAMRRAPPPEPGP